MLEKPSLSDDLIIDCLQQQYEIAVVQIEFLPIGNDASAWVFKVSTDGDSIYFLKVKRGDIPSAIVDVPYFLFKSGIQQVIAPIPNKAGKLSAALNDYVLILYPYVVGKTGMDIGLSTRQWTELGAILKQIHTTPFPPEVLSQIPRETFNPNPRWIATIQAVPQRLAKDRFVDNLEKELAVFWQEHHKEIASIVSRTEKLGRLLQARSLPLVVCHADFHTANVLVNQHRQLFIVDWDQTIYAPKERDLMFVVDGHDHNSGQAQYEPAFMQGYGQTAVDWLALAYYRYEWVMQEIADYAERVFFNPAIGTVTKMDAVTGFIQLFQTGDVVDSAYAAEAFLGGDRLDLE